jgi:uncharacterized protein YndB with AHSA1/START domain
VAQPGREHLFQLAKVAGVGVLRWRDGTDGHGLAGDRRPADPVFAALVDPEALTAWLPPDGMSGRFERFDARPGGSYRLVLTYADALSARGKATADSDIVEAHFVDVVPGVRVVQAADFVSDDPTHAGTMTMTWEVTALDAGTRVDIRSDDVPAGSSAKDQAAGLASSLANLATYLEQ